MESMARLPVRRVCGDEDHALERRRWPATIPAVRQLLDEGLELGVITVLSGENGAGKSTLVEAIALAFGLSAERGSTGARNRTRESESPLHDSLRLERGPGASRRGYFLRAEAMHGLFTYLERNPGARPEPVFHEMSHGESFVQLVNDRFRGPGLWMLDEPESALSLTGCLALLSRLGDLARTPGAQIILSTHSPVLAALPGAVIYEVGDWGFRRTEWADLDMVRQWRLFLDDPERFLHFL